MSIQQALNNMLFTAQVGAGLYAHSPAGKEKTEYRQLEKAYQKTEGTYSQWAEPTTEEEIEIYEDKAQVQADIAAKMYSIRPTLENYKRYKETLGGLTEKIESKKSQKEELKNRKENLKRGTPGMTGIEEYLKKGGTK